MNREDQTKSDLDERVRKAIETSEKAAADYRRAVSEATKAMELLESDGGALRRRPAMAGTRSEKTP